MSSNLRPYYNPVTFKSPIKGYDGMGIVTNTSNGTGNGDYGPVITDKPADRGNFDYLDVDFGSTGDTVSTTGLSMLRLYSKIFLSQPWEVSRLLLQVGDWNEPGKRRVSIKGSADSPTTTTSSTTTPYVEEEEEEEDTELDYFTAVTGENLRPRPSDRTQRERKRRSPHHQQHHSRRGSRSGPEYDNLIRNVSIRFVDIISALNEKDGFKGLWRGLNTTFIIDALASTIEAWVSGFLSSVSGIPDPHFVEVVHSPNPLISLFAAVTANIVTAVVLSPLDMIRTRMTVTTFDSKYARSVRTSLWQLESFNTPMLVLIPTVLHSGLTSLVSKATPYLLYTRFGIDSFKSPSLYNIFTLFSSLFELGLKLPFETMMRRAHIASMHLDPNSLIIRPKEYPGVLGTFWNVIMGNDSIETLFRGWRVSLAGTLGEWGVKAIQSGGEKSKERF
ncbi:mitochondrial fusion and transport protein Ugo1p [Trichomonascus vanleenenianus]|uniref:mitofusin complex protein UGO1 n=1 Tax=Trichomonascus vanleenenianus TaxID=2268995 RepID=UPI003ECA6F27